MLAGVVDHCFQASLRLGEGPAFGGDVTVVEAEVGDAELGDELECRIEFRPPGGDRIQPVPEPGPVEGTRAEHVLAGRGEGVPHTHGDPEVFLHALAQHKAIGLVDLVGQRIVGIEAAEGNGLSYVLEEAITHGPSSFGRSRRHVSLRVAAACLRVAAA